MKVLDFQIKEIMLLPINMSKINLTTEQKTGLECRHKKARDARESDRIKAVLLRSEGWTIEIDFTSTA
jgi:hypothetical protein